MEFPCVGDTTWTLTPEKRDEYADIYLGCDVDAELRAALQWCRDNKTKRKTLGGMTRFLNSWLKKANDRGGSPYVKQAPLAAVQSVAETGDVDAEFLKSVAVLSEGTGKPMTPEQIRVWYACLCDLPSDAIRQAVVRFLAEDGQFESIHKIRRLALECTQGVQVDAYEAFELAMACCRKYGYVSPQAAREELGDRIWATVRRLGGWGKFCDWEDSRGMKLHHFCNAYNELIDRQQKSRLQITGRDLKALDAISVPDTPESLGSTLTQLCLTEAAK